MQTVDYVFPSDDLLRSFLDFPYLDLVPGMPKLRHIGKITFVRLRRFQPLRKSEFAVPPFSEVWLLPGEQSPTIDRACRVLDGPGRSPPLVISLRLDINHKSPFDALRLLKAGLSPFTFHIRLTPSHFSAITSHSSLPR